MGLSVFTIALAAAGLIIGPLLGWLSVRLPEVEGAGARPVRYLAFTLAVIGIGVWAALGRDLASAALLTAVLGWMLLLIAVVDAEHLWLPDQLTWPLTAVGLGAALLPGGTGLLNSAIGATAGFAGLWLIGFAYRKIRERNGLGGGDPFLLAAGGAWVGWMGLISVLLWAVGAGLVVLLACLALRKPLGGQDRLAFGVFIAVGVWMTWMFGPPGL